MLPPRPSLKPIQIDARLLRHLKPIKGGTFEGRAYDIPGWDKWPIMKQIAFIRAWVETTARDPAMSDLATRIFRAAGVPARAYREQWAALLRWVQTRIYYVNERNERLQSPQYTITRGYGDCDDMVIVLMALAESVRLPWRLVISGYTKAGEKHRWVEGQGPVPAGVTWSHIYGMSGWPPFRPTRWAFAEPTLKGAPLGWDVLDGGGRLPELGSGEAVPPPNELQLFVAGLPAPVRFVAELPWSTILAATIPSVLAAWAIQRVVSKESACGVH